MRALDSVDLPVPRGKITCLLGPNGAGKTTLIKILASLVLPDSGELLYEGDSYERAGKRILGKIGLVTPNERAFYWRLSGRENLNFYGSLHGYRGAQLERRVEESLAETGMTASADAPYRLYSAGMKQKLNISRTLLGDPELYLLDEPAAHLDPLAREEFWSFVAKTLVQRRGAAVLLCTHDMAEARSLADEIVILDAGKVVARGEREELMRRVRDEGELTLTCAGRMPEGWLSEYRDRIRFEGPGTVRVSFRPEEDDREKLIASFVESGGRLLEAYVSGDSLLELLKRLSAKHV